MKGFVAIGKYGDIFSVLPILKREFELTKEKPLLLVSKQYQDALEGVKYVKPVLFDGHWSDLYGALKMAKQLFDEVVVLQTHGKDFPMRHRTPSFQIDGYLNAGAVKFWDKLGLDIERIESAGVPKEPFCLVADKSESSPFEAIDELMAEVEKVSGVRVIRLSEISLPSPRHLLSYYDAAKFIVAIDTMHLHLSRATRTPVLALATDSPSRWRGTAFQNRFSFYCRYSEWAERKSEFSAIISDLMAGRKTPNLATQETEKQFGYNLSRIEYNGQRFSSYRYHPDPKDWRTRLRIVVDGKESDIIFPENLSEYSHEDARFFVHNSSLFISYTLSTAKSNFFKGVVGYAQLINEDGEWRVISHLQPKYGSNNFDGIEKNWVFFSSGGKLYFIYKCHQEQIVCEIEGDKVIREYKTPAPIWGFGDMRGGTSPVEFKGRWLRFFHSQTNNQKEELWWRYYVGAYLMESRPPFRITKISSRPILSGNDEYFYGNRFYKPQVVIPYGCIKSGASWLLSVGVNDSACKVAEIKEEHLNL